MSTIDEIKSRIDIVDLASEAGVKLRRSGRNYTGFCPFHSNTRTPAFVIWPESGTWRCFGECNDGGDIFKFVMKKEGVDFKEALQRLADRAGVKLEKFTPEKQEQLEENDRLRNLLEDAVQFYRHHLLNTPAGKPALDYLLEKRKLTPQTIETFGLGYAPDAWDAALKHFTAKGYSEQDVYDAGLATQRDSGGLYDRFRHRIMIPIRDENGRMAGFGARIHPDDPNKEQAKFINTAETPIFSKGRLLYGLDRARRPIRAADQAVIVEGYLDVIALHQAGYENVVSPMGTALTEDQMRLLKRFTRKIILALDPDAAGQKAVLRGLEAARASMDREDELRFDARGLLRHEARLQADLRVAIMPDALDPDEIVERNPEEWATLMAQRPRDDRTVSRTRKPEEWAALMSQAKPIVEHVLETLIADKNINDPKVKAEIASQVLPLIEDLPNPVERDTYRQMLARRLRVDERSLTGKAATRSPFRRRRPAQEPVQEQKTAEAATLAARPRKLEAACLGILLRRPDLLPRLDRRLQKSGLGALTATDFEYTDHQLILRLLQQALEQDESETPHFVEAHLGDDLMETFRSLTGTTGPKEADDRLLDEVTRQVLQLRRQMLSESLNQLRFLQEEAQQAGDALASTYQQMVLQYTRSLNYLDIARKQLSEYRRE
jgi:DNA primase